MAHDNGVGSDECACSGSYSREVHHRPAQLVQMDPREPRVDISAQSKSA